jgi:hypothetical protein
MRIAKRQGQRRAIHSYTCEATLEDHDAAYTRACRSAQEDTKLAGNVNHRIAASASHRIAEGASAQASRSIRGAPVCHLRRRSARVRA